VLSVMAETVCTMLWRVVKMAKRTIVGECITCTAGSYAADKTAGVPVARKPTVKKRAVRCLSLFLSLVMAFSMLSLSLFVSSVCAATNVDYLDENGNTQTAPSTTDLTGGAAAVTLNDTGATGGWYSVAGTITYTGVITISGDVHLILMDGCHLEALMGIRLTDSNSLTIYAQSTETSMGRLTASPPGNAAGIGGHQFGSVGETCGTIVINGGEILASGNGGAGIGGGNGGSQGGSGGIITINGGRVTATAYSGAAIGGGAGTSYSGDGGIITINGGTVVATTTLSPSTPASGAGIGGGGGGGGRGGSGGIITINGGTITATSGIGSAGIGGGMSLGNQSGGSGGTITITGGSIQATGGNTLGSGPQTGGGAGIGSGGSPGTSAPSISVGTINIGFDATIVATGGTGAGYYGSGAVIGQGGYFNNSGAGINTFASAPATQAVMAGEAATFAVSVPTTGAPPPAPDYQWKVSTDGGITFADVTGGTGGTAASYSTGSTSAAMDGSLYSCEVTVTGGNLGTGSIKISSAPASLTVITPEDYGLLFDTVSGTFYLDIDGDGTVSSGDLEYVPPAGTATWSPLNLTLTFNDFSWITSASVAFREVGGPWDRPFTLNLIGTNTITSEYLGGGYTWGMTFSVLDLVVDGSGSLTVTGGDFDSSGTAGAGLNARNITMKGGELYAYGGNGNGVSCGIEASSLMVEGGVLHGEGGNALASFGIWANDVTVLGGTLFGYGNTASWGVSMGLRLLNLIFEEGTLVMQGEDGAFDYNPWSSDPKSVTVAPSAYSYWASTALPSTAAQIKVFNGTGSGTPYAFDADHLYLAFETLIVYNVNVSAGAGGTVPAISGQYPEGHSLSITATASSGYAFDEWTATGITLANPSAAAITVVVPQGSIELVASFKVNDISDRLTDTPGTGDSSGIIYVLVAICLMALSVVTLSIYLVRLRQRECH